jgi:hypothetical protein
MFICFLKEHMWQKVKNNIVRKKLKQHYIIIWTGIKPINNPRANITLEALKILSDV